MMTKIIDTSYTYLRGLNDEVYARIMIKIEANEISKAEILKYLNEQLVFLINDNWGPYWVAKYQPFDNKAWDYVITPMRKGILLITGMYELREKSNGILM